MNKILIIGGDERQIILKNLLENEGYKVGTWGLFENDNGNIEEADIVFLPIPSSKDKVHIHTPLVNRKITLEEIYNKTNPNQLIIGYNIAFSNRKIIDLNKSDEFAIENAIPTAEGAIIVAANETNFTIFNSSFLVIGFGRIGKVLADRLKALGAKVTISARKEYDLGLAKSLGFKTIKSEAKNLKIMPFDIIFNTVDAEIINENDLEELKTKLIIDLSSALYISKLKLENQNLKIVNAPALPSRFFKNTSAQILKNIIIKTINSHK